MSIIKKVCGIGVLIAFFISLFPLYNLSADVNQPTALPYQGVGTWHTQTVDDNVRRNGSLGITSNNNPAIIYESEYLLKFAIWTGSQWGIETIDDLSLGTLSASFAFDHNDIPHVSYTECQIGGCFENKIEKYGVKSGDNWSISQYLDGYGSLAIDNGDEVHVGYHHNESESVRHMSLVGNTWITTTIASGPITNTHVALTIDNNDNPRVSYYEGDVLYHAIRTSNIWTPTAVGFVQPASPVTGQFSALAIDSNNYSHIAYFDGNGNDLKYTYWDGFEWIKLTVDTEGNVGKYVSMALDSNDLPHIVYYDATNQAVKYAHRVESGWRTVTLESGIGSGEATSILIDEDRVHISYSVYYDPANRYLKYAWGDLTPNFNTVYLPTIIN